ncbi:MAG TPA: serine hydrolase domain-containing protein [Iamia sp.]|nr:serine hydrolase domain-containing protein [Iamia sp.]
MGTEELADRVEAVAAESHFSGVVRVDAGGEVVLERAYGWAHRAYRVPMTVDTRLATASATKSLTALTVLGLAADGTLPLATPARELLGADLPLIDDRVTVEHLLAHRSGIGDHVDEEGDIDAYVLPVPVHTLADTEAYLPVLDGRPPVFAPDERFTYCNAGFVLLALLAERASGTPFVDLVMGRVCEPAGLADTHFLRSDDLPERTALGYIAADGDRTNLLHIPVRGTGDGGHHTTVADVHRFWASIDPDLSAVAWAPRSDAPDLGMRYGLGFWLGPTGPVVLMEGYDAGVSFRSVHDPVAGTTHTVISNWSDGAWPLAKLLRETLNGW